jgi:transcription elongation GreA/GreB family factor
MSPIGSALISHKKGDKVKVQTPKGAVEYIIAKIK